MGNKHVRLSSGSFRNLYFLKYVSQPFLVLHPYVPVSIVSVSASISALSQFHVMEPYGARDTVVRKADVDARDRGEVRLFR